ncbi:VanZ family protein [Brachybacterium nesterenkovii]|uniref:VanZ family protein n=1 Tax=Brachybacterium nesterenkovii TaxID=47847 RepID=UPI00321B63B6
MARATGPATRRLKALAVGVLAPAVPAGAALLLAPDGWAINRLNVAVWIAVTKPLGLMGTTTPEQFAAVMNVLVFVPVLAALAVLRPTWWWAALAAAGSVGVELYQMSLGTREPDLGDVLANTLGAVLGVGLGLLALRAARRADARRACARRADDPRPDAPGPARATTSGDGEPRMAGRSDGGGRDVGA